MELPNWLSCSYEKNWRTIRLIMAKDACYHKVVRRYGPKTSAYRSGAMAKCRKVGVANWGEGGKKKKKKRKRKMMHGGKIGCLVSYQKD